MTASPQDLSQHQARIIPLFGADMPHGRSQETLDSSAAALIDAIAASASGAGGSFLFEVPGMLLSAPGMRAAAISTGEGGEIIFVVFDPVSGDVACAQPQEIPQGVADMARSYAGVLNLIASHRRPKPSLVQ